MEPANKRKLVIPDSPSVVQKIPIETPKPTISKPTASNPKLFLLKAPPSEPINIPPPTSQPTNIPKRRGGLNENGINVLKEIQARARELKEEGMKHREAIAQAGAEYREKNGTVRARPKVTKKTKGKKK